MPDVPFHVVEQACIARGAVYKGSDGSIHYWLQRRGVLMKIIAVEFEGGKTRADHFSMLLAELDHDYGGSQTERD